MNNTTPASALQPQTVLDPGVIPPAMRAARRWLTHLVGRKQPLYVSGRARSGKLDSERDTKQLATFDDAYAAVRDSGGTLGLGFALGAGWHGGDMDNVRDPASAALTPWAKAIIEACGTYVEVSQSGKGLHVLTYDAKASFDALGANGSGAEFYSRARYFIVTGRCLKPAPKRWPKAGKVRDLFAERWSSARLEGVPLTASAEPWPPTSAPSLEWPDFQRRLREGLRHVPCGRPRGRWLAVMMGIHNVSGGNEEGFEIAHAWSAKATDGSYTGEADLRKQWLHGFKRKDGKRIGWGTVQMYLDEFKPKPEAQLSPHKLPTTFTLDELDDMDIPATQWLVEGLIAPGLTLLTAPPKQGKSYLSLQMGMCVAAGVHFLGRATQACRVTYFDLEEWHGLLRERVVPIRAGNLIPKGVPLVLKLETGVGPEAVEDMRREIAAGSKLLIVDLLARIRDEMSEDAKKNVYARDMKFVGMLAGFALANPGVAIIVVHHANKGNHDDWQNKISGSAGMAGASHANLYMARPNLAGMSEDDKRDAMRYRVLHANGKQVREQELTLEMMDADAGWQVSGLKAWEIHTTRKQKKILEVLRAHAPAWVPAKDVATLLGLKLANVRQMMYQMRQQGAIESDGRGGDGYRAKVSS